MSSRSRIGGTLVAMVATMLLAVGSGAAANGVSKAGDKLKHRAEARSVTLVSGDRVTVLASGNLAVVPRAGVGFVTQKVKGHHYVIPTDAMPLLAADKLDKRLFDVTALLEAGYDKRSELPVIVQGAAKAPAGLTASRKLPLAKGLAAKAGKEKLAEVWKGLKAQGLAKTPSYKKIWLDGLRKPTLDVSVPQIGAPAAWASGLDGAGVKVAVLDTGIDPAHPDLAGKILAEKNFGGEYEDELDRVGHGTHVASTIAGTGAASGGKYKGVAPGASLLDGKVCVEFGCAESWILDGMQWAADNGAQVVNMSLGGGDGPEIDPIEQAVNDLSASHGMLFVIAAGNAGFFGDETLSSPASADAALAVGAVDKSDAYAPFSSRGPRIGDAALKPEITGPGVSIVAARSKDGFLGTPGESYMPLSGTSMATPHVAGAAAILTQQHPQWTAQQRKAALMAAANPNATDGPFTQGAGRVDVARAITQNVTASPAAVSLGRQAWPHDDDTPDVRTITYHNSGTAAITLQLALDTPASGIFSLSANSVTVPAGGDASVTLTSDTRQGGATVGYLGGRVVATAEGVRALTPFAVERESERFAIDLTITDRAGQPATDAWVTLLDQETWKSYDVTAVDGIASARVPAGKYIFATTVFDVENLHITQFWNPVLQVSANQAMTLDARLAKTYDVTVPDAATKGVMFAVDNVYKFEQGTASFGLMGDEPSQITTLQLGPKQVEGVSSVASIVRAKPGPAGDLFGSDTVYIGGWRQDGSSFDGLVKHVTAKEFAKVKQDFRPQGGKSGLHFLGLVYPDLGGVSAGLAFSVPFQREVFVTEASSWEHMYEEYTAEVPDFDSIISRFGHTTGYKAGQRATENWSHAVFGPSFPPSDYYSYVVRYQDIVGVDVPLFSDSAGHAGGSLISSASTALYRNGELVGKVDQPYGYFEGQPAEKARYKAEVTVERGAPYSLSTKVHCVWEFDSAATEDVTDLPVTAFGFTPELDRQNMARAGQALVVPVTVHQQKSAQALKKLTVSVSTDDGKTWKNAPVITLFGKTFVVVKNPAKGFVSLRAQAVDKGGNTVDQTIIRAYAVK